MPNCEVLKCKNKNRNINHSKGSVTYHRFPQNEAMREQWIKATGRINWSPSRTSTICSEHFLPSEIITSDRGFRHIYTDVVPSINLVPKENISIASSCRNKIARTLIDMIDTHSNKSHTTSATKTKTKSIKKNSKGKSISSISEEGPMAWFQEKLEEKNLEIRNLQALNEKIKMKLYSTEEALKALEAKIGSIT